MTLYRVEYQRPAGPSWWASTWGVTLDPGWASRFTLADAEAHVRRTLATYAAERLRARVTLATTARAA